MRIAKLILSTLFTICILGLVAGGVLYFHLKSSLPSVESLKTVELQQPMQIYTADGKLIGEVGEQRRIPVKLENVPQRLQDAFLATEDSRFYEHHGLDPVGIARAIFVAVNNGGASQGASTITQQLARNFFLTPEKTIIRKAREAVLAIEIENALSKHCAAGFLVIIVSTGSYIDSNTSVVVTQLPYVIVRYVLILNPI